MREDGAWRWLGLSFLVGAVVDLGFGIAILAAAEALAPLMRVTLSTPRVYMDLNGLFLCALGLIYVLIWRQPRRLVSVAAAATLLRFAGCALFFASVAVGRAEPTFALIGTLDGGLAVWHWLILKRTSGGLVTALLDRGGGETPMPPGRL